MLLVKTCPLCALHLRKSVVEGFSWSLFVACRAEGFAKEGPFAVVIRVHSRSFFVLFALFCGYSSLCLLCEILFAYIRGLSRRRPCEGGSIRGCYSCAFAVVIRVHSRSFFVLYVLFCGYSGFHFKQSNG